MNKSERERRADELAALNLYEDRKKWLKNEMRAGRYRDPHFNLDEVVPLLGEGPPAQVLIGTGENRTESYIKPTATGTAVTLTEADGRYIQRVARARCEYFSQHEEELNRYLERCEEERRNCKYEPQPVGESLIEQHREEIEVLNQQWLMDQQTADPAVIDLERGISDFE